MYAILKKEINYFFSSLIGPIVLVLFLVINSIFLWVYPINDYLNILESGFSSLEPLFMLAPWMYLILIPAITMRTFSEEYSEGTIELLFTKPISKTNIVLGKFLACFFILLLTLLPTIIYFITVNNYGQPVGNIDKGGTYGSYIGLLLLGAAFISIGIFASSISKNQIIALLLSILLSIFCYIGFEMLSESGVSETLAYQIKQLGIEAHYYNISRGLLSTKDIVYYLGFIGIFLASSQLVIKSRTW